MKVLFLQNIKGVAQIGDIKNVSDGYARNYLLPRKVARSITPDSLVLSEKLKMSRVADDSNRKAHAEEIAKKLDGVVLEIHEDANSEGHLYGSVDEKKIVHEFKNIGVNINIDDIKLSHHLKTVGEHAVELSVHPDIKTIVKVSVLPNKR